MSAKKIPLKMFKEGNKLLSGSFLNYFLMYFNKFTPPPFPVKNHAMQLLIKSSITTGNQTDNRTAAINK